MSIDNYNERLAKLAGLTLALSKEIENDTNLKKGEKFLLLQRYFADTILVKKSFEKIKKEFENFAKENLYDTGDGTSQEVEVEGVSILVKYSYPKDTLDAEKLKEELERTYAELNIEFDEKKFLKTTTPRRQVIIQSILEKNKL
jgi:hypothetical protein